MWFTALVPNGSSTRIALSALVAAVGGGICPSAAFAATDTALDSTAEGARALEGRVSESEPTATPRTIGQDDHDQIVGGWGFELMDLGSVNDALAVGVRRWGSPGSGWEAGVSLAINSADGDASFGIGGQFGYLLGISQFKHLVVFFEPDVGLGVFAPDGGDMEIRLAARASLGAEVQLGMIGLTELALTARVSAGLTLANDGGSTTFFIGTLGGQNTSARGLLEGTIGFVVYFDTEGSTIP